MWGSVEGGGTKWVCAVGTGPDDIRAETTIPTTTPDETLGAVIDFFGEHGPVDAVGVATFGPVELRPGHVDYGRITTTPKPDWSGADVVGPIHRALGVPIGFETDVNGAAMGEMRWGAGVGLESIIYLTVGTGVGGGAISHGTLVGGLSHPEMGHVSVPRHPTDRFPGACPFHGDCLEGMAAGPTLEARWGMPAPDLPASKAAKAIEIEAHYLAHGLRNFVYTLAPELIILGGGVSKMPGLVESVGEKLVEILADYAPSELSESGFVVRPGLGARSGIAGGFALAQSVQ